MPNSTILNEESREILIYDVITDDDGWVQGVSPRRVKEALDRLGAGPVTVRINSPGGSVFAASAMYALLQERAALVMIDGAALSAASYLATVGDRVVMAAGAMLMIHDPWTIALGDASELRKTADVLDKIKEQLVDAYHLRTGIDEEELAEWMREETWFTPSQALELHFVDEVTEHKRRVESRFDLSRFKHAPKDWPKEPATPHLDRARSRLAACA